VTHTHTHTHTLSRTPLDKGSVRSRDLYLTTHNTHNRQTDRQPYPSGISYRNPSKRVGSDSRKLAIYEVVFRGSITFRQDRESKSYRFLPLAAILSLSSELVY